MIIILEIGTADRDVSLAGHDSVPRVYALENLHLI